MTIAFFQPQALFTIKPKLHQSRVVPLVQCQNQKHRAVAVFSHHRDVKVALDDLECSGFSHDSLTLIGRQARRCVDYSELVISSSFDDYGFSLSPAIKKFLRLFKRGKYLLLVNGSEHDVNAASKIISRRRNRAEVWRFE